MIYLARAGVVVNGDNIRLRELTAQLLNHTLACNVIRQARKRLYARDIRNAGVYKLNHLAREEPALAGAVTQLQYLLSALGNISDMLRRPCAEFRIVLHKTRNVLSVAFNAPDCEVAQRRRRRLHTEIVTLEVVVVETVEHKVRQSRHNRFAAFFLNDINNIVIRIFKFFF